MNEPYSRFSHLRLRLKRVEDFINGLFFTPKHEYIQMDTLEELDSAAVVTSGNTTNTYDKVNETLASNVPASAASSSQSSASFRDNLLEAVFNAFSAYGQPSFPTTFFQPHHNAEQGQQLGRQLSSEAVVATAKNPAFAQIAAFFLVIAQAIADAFAAIQKHFQENSAAYNSAAQIYARSGCRMG